jgi:transposase
VPLRTLEVKPTTKSTPTLYLAMELSKKTWKLAFSDGGERMRMVSVHGGAIDSVRKAVATAKVKYRLPADTRVLSCYEAGRDGFWIHRELVAGGFENVVVDATSIEVDRRQRRTKTDRIDAGKLVMQLVRHDERGDRLRVVRVPTPGEEDARRPGRELERLKKERSAHSARMKALLFLCGIQASKLGAGFAKLVAVMTQPNGKPVPAHLQGELRREAERLELVRAQVRELERERAAALKERKGKAAEIAARLMLLKGIGVNAATTYAYEFFSWREFKNRRQVGASAGMTGTPYDSGGSKREQGISKAGNRRVRAMAIEVAWQWLRNQPDSRLARWYVERFGSGAARARRVGIVALARKILVALWQYVDHGLIPEGAVMK